MIHFNHMTFKNFLSVGDQPTEIQLDKTITSIVTGVNGAGKSTFVDALTYVLFGKPYRKVKLGQLINTVNEKGLVVEVSFTIGSKIYTVKRGMKPALFEIYINGTDPEHMLEQPATTADYQYILENDILKLNYKTFTQIIILGNAGFKPFMQLRLADRREIIEDLLDITVFSEMNKILKSKVKDLKMNIIDVSHILDLSKDKHKTKRAYLLEATETHEKRIETTKRYIRDANMNARLRGIDIDGHNEHIDEIENSMLHCEGYGDMYKKLTDDISKVEIKIAGDESNYNSIAKNASVVEGIKVKIKDCGKKIIDRNKQKSDLVEEENRLKKIIDGYTNDDVEYHDIETACTILTTEMSTKMIKLEFYKKNDQCPECKQSIEELFKSNTINDLQTEIKAEQEEFDGYQERLAKIDAKRQIVSNLTIEYTKLGMYIVDVDHQVDQLDNSINLMNTSLNTMVVKTEKELNVMKAVIDRMKNDVHNLSAKRVTVKEKHDEYKKLDRSLTKVVHDRDIETEKFKDHNATAIKLGEELVDLDNAPACSITQDDIDLLANKIRELDTDLIKKKSIMHYYGIVQRLLKDDGIKTKIIRKFMPIINATVNMYLDKLDFPINFNFDENFNETIQSNFRNDFSYYSFSEGEKSRIDLAILFTWREIALKKSRNATNIIIFDEIFDGSLDDGGIDNFMTILGLGEDYSSYIITHDKDVKTNEFERNMHFTKDGHFSKLKET